MNKQGFETLLLHKAELQKECLEIEERYYLRFGDELAELLRLKLEVALIRKKISYCQRKINAGLPVNEKEMEKEARDASLAELSFYNDAVGKIGAAKELLDAPKVPLKDMDEIKKTFRLLMKLTHPDMHPEWQSDPLCAEIYAKGLSAYKRNDLKELKDLYALAMLYFSSDDFEIEDMEERAIGIKNDIEHILTSTPYTYLEILENPEKEKEHHLSIKKDKDEFAATLSELTERLSLMLEKGMTKA